MAADFSKPTTSSTKANFPGEIVDNFATCIKMSAESDGSVSVPDGAFSINVTLGKLRRLISGVWSDFLIKSAGLDPDAASRSTLLFDLEVEITSGSAPIASLGPILRIARECKATHLSIAIHYDDLGVLTPIAVSSGGMTLTLYKNGLTTGQALTITNTGFADAKSGAITAQSYAVNDTLELALTKSTTVFTGSTSPVFIRCQVWGHFTG